MTEATIQKALVRNCYKRLELNAQILSSVGRKWILRDLKIAFVISFGDSYTLLSEGCIHVKDYICGFTVASLLKVLYVTFESYYC